MRPLAPCLLLVSIATLHGCVSFSGSTDHGLLQKVENSLVFQPRTDKERWFTLPPHVKAEDVWLELGTGEHIHAWWFVHPESDGAVLFCHGNAGNLSQWAPRMVGLQQSLKKSVLIFDYPGYGKSTGKPSEQGCYDAADAAYKWLKDHRGMAPEKIVLCGESLGGGVATELAVRRPHAALVLIRTFMSVPDVARGNMLTSSSAPLMRNTFDNLKRIPQCSGPIFIAHGDRDRLIPLEHGKQLFAAAPEPKEFFLMKGCGHNEPYPDELYTTMAAFLSRTTATVAPVRIFPLIPQR